MSSGLQIAFVEGPAQSPALPIPETVARLLSDGCAVETFEDQILDDGGIEALATWYALRPALEREQRIRYRVLRDDEPVATFIPAVGLASPVAPSANVAIRLSRFAHLRRDGDAFILDSARSLGRVELHSAQAVAMLWTVSDGSAEDSAFVGLLLAAGLALPVGGDGTTAEDRDPTTAGWEFHDLVFHERSRPFRTDRPVGATNRFGESTATAPSARAELEAIALVRPDIETLARNDVPFTRVLESRRSRRFHADEPITIAQLGDFLFRTMRTTSRDGESAKATGRFRVYPGGGACHPLETYVVVGRCTGLEPGLYHYLADAHALAVIECDASAVQSLIRRSAVPMERGSEQQLQLVLTARFSRINRRYEGNAYALVLQEVGAVYQTMYLVATAMGLAGCAVGGGNADAFARLIGTNPLEEASVGAFVLGSAE